MQTTVTLSWDELPIDQALLREAIAHGVRGQLLDNQEFRSAIEEAIRNTGPEAVSKAVAETVNHDLIHFMKSKLQPLKDELNAVIKDFDYMERSHASEYAARRKKELLAKLHDLNSL